MRGTDHLLEKEKKKARMPSPPKEPDDFELTLELPVFRPLDSTGSLFDRAAEKNFGGLNTRKSVFDRDAVFKTQTEK